MASGPPQTSGTCFSFAAVAASASVTRLMRSGKPSASLPIDAPVRQPLHELGPQWRSGIAPEWKAAVSSSSIVIRRRNSSPCSVSPIRRGSA